MGCDIHWYREKREGGKWVAADVFVNGDIDWDKQFSDRNYNLFGMLAGVRVREEPPYKFAPRGLPVGLCKEIADQAEEWGSNGYTQSYLYLHELEDLRSLLNTTNIVVSGMKNSEELVLLEASIEAGKPDWELLYPYCQGTNDSRQRAFSIEAPAIFMVGPSLDKLISGLQEIGGEQQRGVFWFDN